jgi:hypothetical protein
MLARFRAKRACQPAAIFRVAPIGSLSILQTNHRVADGDLFLKSKCSSLIVPTPTSLAASATDKPRLIQASGRADKRDQRSRQAAWARRANMQP